MASKKISEAALAELQNALGEGNVSADPGLLQVYSYMNSLFNAPVGLWWISPVAVTLPSSVEEVQKVIAICRKHDLKVKPHSAAWLVTALACSNDVVILDLRRMNSIVDIQKEDGYVVIEPYCTSGEQQVEIMKYGLNSHVNGAGPNACILSSATSMQGSGGTSQSMSNSERNCLGVELVTTSGEIVHFGSPGTPNAGYFCGDGPGPSLRGMMRGAIGNVGGQGVYTKVGAKCYPWYMPPFECEGPAPFFQAKELPNYILRTAFWPDYNTECDALYRIGEGELVDYCARLGPGAYEEAASTTNEEYMSMVESGIYRNTFPKGAWTFSFAASCPEELEARLKTVELIVEDTGGIMIDPVDLGVDAYQVVFQTAIRGCYIFKAAFMPTGAMGCFPPMSYETIDNLWKVNININDPIKKDLIAREAIEDDYYDNNYASLDEHGHFGHIESPWHTEFWEPKEESISGALVGVIEGLRKHVPIAYSPMTVEGRELLNYIKYLGKIQGLIDPHKAMDALQASAFGMIRDLDDLDELEISGEPEAIG
ncbi:MAG: FAD-binding oxidoreductase [Actinobacteria bacterium]|nr:FAD-binding oxidoreductase [Actinomycetota bacterium]